MCEISWPINDEDFKIPSFTHFAGVSISDFGQVNAGWVKFWN